MKRQVMGLAAALACGVGMGGENLLKNGDFECGAAKGWDNWCPHTKMEIVKEGAHGGTRALDVFEKAARTIGIRIRDNFMPGICRSKARCSRSSFSSPAVPSGS